MAPVIEVATAPLASGVNIEDKSSDAGKVWQDTINTVSSQPGFSKAFYGLEVENANVLQFVIGWDSLDAHHAFTKSSHYEPFVKHFRTIVDGPVTIYNVGFDPHPPADAIGAPITEVVTCYCASDNPSLEGNARKFFGVLKGMEGFKGASAGWVIEDVEHESLGAGNKGKAFIAALGWESLDAHMKARQTNELQENVKLLKEGTSGVEVHHTKFQPS